MVKSKFKTYILHASDGRYCAGICTEDDVSFAVICIYSSNSDSPNFFDNVVRKSFELCDKIVLVDVFNAAMNSKIDRNMSNNSHPHTLKKLNQLCREGAASLGRAAQVGHLLHT